MNIGIVTFSKRDTRLDGIKFVLIMLVIIGHIKQFTLCDNLAFSVRLINKINHLIYLFHMPLFIMISGYFSRKKENNDFWISTWRLIRIYLVFHLFWVIIDVINYESLDINRFFYPSFSLWYLHCLIIWRIILQYIPYKFLNNNLLVLILSFLISLLGGFIPVENFLAIQRLFCFMPLFFLGFYVKKFCWLDRIYNLKWYFFFLIIPVLFVDLRVTSDIWGREPYLSLFDMLRRLIFISSSILISMAFIRLLPLKVTLFSDEGRDVLFYYMYHSIVLLVISTLLRSAGIIADGSILLLVFIFTVLTLYFMRRVNFFHFILR